MTAYLPPEPEIYQVDSLLSILADPKKARINFDKLVADTRTFNALADGVRRQQKEVDDYKASIQPTLDTISKTKADLEFRAKVLDQKVKDIDDRESQLLTRETTVSGKEKSLLAKEEEINSKIKNSEAAISLREQTLNSNAQLVEKARKEAEALREEYIKKINTLKSII